MDIKKLCRNVPPEIRQEVETLARAVESLQKKILEQMPVYESLPLAQEATTTQGERVKKANPALSEYRATVRDYAQTLAKLDSILDKQSAPKDETVLNIVGNSKWKRKDPAVDPFGRSMNQEARRAK